MADNWATAGDGRASAFSLGRGMLADWEAAQPDNYFTADVGFQRTLEFHWGKETYRGKAGSLYRFGAVLATVVDEAAREANQDANLPRLQRYDGRGERVEEVIFHPSHHEAGRHIYNSGMLAACAEPGNNLVSLSHFYMSSQNGEAGHNCPVACTAGLIKLLQGVGDSGVRERYLERLCDPDYETHYHGAQFLTEVQGGSDVGANATVARPLEMNEGAWLLSGEKWFCSNVTADLALVTARVPGQGTGTAGLGLFLVPRRLDDGRLNNVLIRRLKDKLGTRSMATGELEFRDAVAYQVGPTELGFKNVMSYLINTSRIYNAVGVCGIARRAYVTASTYAQHRSAFGHPIIHFPLVQEMLATMRADAAAMLAGTMRIVRVQDEVETGATDDEAVSFLRMAVNLNKYRSAVLAREVILRAIELLGGNGAIESFSILPRLLRDNVVYENWEGTHNVLLAQIQRDMRRHHIEKPFFDSTGAMLEAVKGHDVGKEGLEELEQIEDELVEVLAMDELTAAIYLRPLMDRLGNLYYGACLAVEAEWELYEKKDRTRLRLASLFFNRRVAGRQAKDIAYYDDIVSRLCQ
jgi:alkylation response protein AidB-like acyl-CoA dehydrogenase